MKHIYTLFALYIFAGTLTASASETLIPGGSPTRETDTSPGNIQWDKATSLPKKQPYDTHTARLAELLLLFHKKEKCTERTHDSLKEFLASRYEHFLKKDLVTRVLNSIPEELLDNHDVIRDLIKVLRRQEVKHQKDFTFLVMMVLEKLATLEEGEVFTL